MKERVQTEAFRSRDCPVGPKDSLKAKSSQLPCKVVFTFRNKTALPGSIFYGYFEVSERQQFE